MKRFLLVGLATSFGLSLFAQRNLPAVSEKLAKQSIVAKRIIFNDQQVISSDQKLPLKAAPLTSTNDLIGTTEYDLQTNNSVQNRVVKHSDGTISAVWTMGTSTFANRGTGYNYFDGSAWQEMPTERLEGVKTGWPSITVADGKEVVICHNSNSSLSMSTRTKGMGAWTTATIPFSSNNSLAWPRAMGKGLNSGTIHLIATASTGQMLYSRSLDGGANWDIQDTVLPGLDPETELLPTGGDSYSMDVNGDTVGIVVGDITSDVVLLKSFDGGTNWTKQIVWQHQIPRWDISIVGRAGSSDANGDLVADTLTVTDGRYALVIDNEGVFHVFMGITKVKRDSTDEASSLSYWPYTDGLAYWNSTQPTIVPESYFYADTLLNMVGYMVDVNEDSSITFNTVDEGAYPFAQYSFASLSSMPSAAVGADGAIYCTYSSVVEGTDNGAGLGYRNIYAVKSTDQGNTWSEPVNITKDDFQECLFGSLNRNVDSDLYMVFQNSSDPGIFLSDPTAANPHPQQTTSITFVKISNDLVSSYGVNDVLQDKISVSQNYPNPFNKSTEIVVNLNSSADLSVSIANLVGQKVIDIKKGIVNSGAHTITIDGSNLKSGIYFYTVKAGVNTVTRKMIVE